MRQLVDYTHISCILLLQTIICFATGNALLTVGMMTPSGHPEAELAVKKASNTSYTVSYNCKEPGEHTLQIKWGDEDIPGSPFNLHAQT